MNAFLLLLNVATGSKFWQASVHLLLVASGNMSQRTTGNNPISNYYISIEVFEVLTLFVLV